MATPGQPTRVVITGASSGLGRAFAVELARRFPGIRMMLVARRGDRLAELAGTLPAATCDCVALDVTDSCALRSACSDFVARHGAPDLVIANAGISAGTVTGLADDRTVFRRIMAVNLLAMVETFDPFIGPMRSAGGGILVGIGSVAGVRGLPGAEAYSASKAAVHSYLESLRVGLRGSGIAVVTVAPGYIRTQMTARNQYPMPFLMPADDFARRALDAILARRSLVTIPWQMGWVARLLRLLPNWLYDRAFANAPRKARDPALAKDRPAAGSGQSVDAVGPRAPGPGASDGRR
jgi:short-subunit dehydrogenase